MIGILTHQHVMGGRSGAVKSRRTSPGSSSQNAAGGDWPGARLAVGNTQREVRSGPAADRNSLKLYDLLHQQNMRAGRRVLKRPVYEDPVLGQAG
ncbi:unnamed protein product [Gadus morhua 'NCC']